MTEHAATTTAPSPAIPEPVWVWGLPLHPLTTPETLDLVDALVAARRPSFFITANLHYAMLTRQNPDMPAINRRAAFVLADGMPLVWASRYKGRSLPERVTGSNLIFLLSQRAAERGHRLFLLGGAPGVGQRAAANLGAKYPGLQIVGIESPHLGNLSDAEHDALLQRIRDARPDLLFVALGQPKGERWITKHLDALAVPVAVQVGASLDFAAGQVRRAPRWMQATGLEWVFRALQEPARLGPRYLQNIGFITRALAADAARALRGRTTEPPNEPAPR
jgi:N-acetylglucosaminyldiphosphoundecaprenol N-acetyl-beta-D-mannosaminyltransferase